MSKTYTVVARFPSSSSDKEYIVKRDENGELSCSCPAWVFKKQGARTCKHLKLLEKGEGIVAQIAVEVKERETEAKGGSLVAIFERLRREQLELERKEQEQERKERTQEHDPDK